MQVHGRFRGVGGQDSEIKARCIEKKLFVEADAEHALALAGTDVDGIQLDKVPVDELAALVESIRAVNPRVTLIATGGINGNASDAATGVDGMASTAPFSVKPA